MSQRYYRKKKNYSGYKSYKGKRKYYSTGGSGELLNLFLEDVAFLLVALVKGIIYLFKLIGKGVYLLYQYVSQAINTKYTNFVTEHSSAIKALHEINDRYAFLPVDEHDMSGCYDNEIFYSSIEPKDYLTYQLSYREKEVLSAIDIAESNHKLYDAYREEVAKIQQFSVYDVEKTPSNKAKLLKTEERIFNELLRKPTTEVEMAVQIILTNIRGRFKGQKSETFGVDVIRDLISRLGQKSGDFYLDKEIWDSICKVERGKVTNKVRFSVYKKYNYRCAKCGSSEDLEVDHIFPIAKGGKSNFENLQTLCHQCNSLKSDSVEEGAIDPQKANRLCPRCNSVLLLKKSQYGDFYGCPNYPRCKHTEKL